MTEMIKHSTMQRKQSKMAAVVWSTMLVFLFTHQIVKIQGQFIDNNRIFQDLEPGSDLDVHVDQVVKKDKSIDDKVDDADVEEEIVQDVNSDRIMNKIIDDANNTISSTLKPTESESRGVVAKPTTKTSQKVTTQPPENESTTPFPPHTIKPIVPPVLAHRIPDTLNSKSVKPKTPPHGVEDIKRLWSLMPNGIDWVRSYLSDKYKHIQKPSKCVNDTSWLLNSFLDGDEWAVMFIDAFGKPGTALTKGWLEIVGNYELCIDHARAPPRKLDTEGQDYPGFGGEYFRLNFVVDSPSFSRAEFHIGLCLPDSCSENEVETRGIDITHYYGVDKGSDFYQNDNKQNADRIRNKRDENSEKKSNEDSGDEINSKAQTISITLESAECLSCGTDVTTATVIAIVLLSVLGILSIVGTTYDVVYIQVPKSRGVNGFIPDPISNGSASLSQPFDKDSNANNYESINSSHDQNGGSHISENVHNEKKKSPSTAEKFLVAFSFYTNANKVLSISEASGSLGPIHGIRFLTMCWVILGHSYLFSLFYCINVTEAMDTYYDRLTFVTIWNAFPSVDSFFALSGLLMSYTTMIQLNKKGWKLNWARFYFHRFWRITPPYMAVLVISLGLTQYLGSGPLWSSRQPFDKTYCEDSWWKNFLFINNFKNLFETCVPHSWYLANDMQFFMITPLLVVPFHFSQILGLTVNGVLLLTCWITTGVLSTVHKWHTGPVSRDYTPDDFREWVEDFYSLPYNRVGPYIIGVVAGYYLTKYQELSKTGATIRLKKWMIVLGWTISTVTALSIIYGIFGDITGDHKSSVGVAAFYNAVSHSIWGLVICWIVLACHMGYGGPINKLLSWSPFIVLGRLTFMVYLLHPYIIMVVYQNLGTPLFANDLTMVTFYLGFLVLSHLLAFIFMLLMESPMVGLEKIFLPEKKDSKEN